MTDYVFINDTTSELHWGCWGVSSSIMRILSTKGSILLRVSTNDLKHKSVDTISKQILSFNSKNPVTVIINGEGSLHENNLEGQKIVDLVGHLKVQERNQKLDYEIWNASFYSIPQNFLNFIVGAKRIVVRDLLSQKVVERYRPVHVCPDLLFYWLISHQLKIHKTNFVFVTDSVNKTALANWSELTSNYLINPRSKWRKLEIRWDIIDYWKITSLIKCSVSINIRDLSKLLYRSIKNPKYKVRYSSMYVGKIVATGRYHLAVMLLYHGISFIALPTNSQKISALIELFLVGDFGINLTSERHGAFETITVNEIDHVKLRRKLCECVNVYFNHR